MFGVTEAGGQALQLAATYFALVAGFGGWLGGRNILYAFSGGADGANPYDGLVLDKQGDSLYGATYSGGTSNEGVSFQDHFHEAEGETRLRNGARG